MSAIYEAYKPLRNYLGKAPLATTLQNVAALSER